ncbi:nucleoside phosphatase family-domain-containing protein [Peziza echinospora]|nr:nucleoside phosphatase family-domain-containing protein [Peziza echinospora]
MSSVRRRPSIFSYFYRQQQPTGRYGRSDSVGANFRPDDDDPYEKADRQSSGDLSGGDMTQGGRTRIFKSLGIVVVILLALWIFLPTGSLNRGGMESSIIDNALKNTGGKAAEPVAEVKPTTSITPAQPIQTSLPVPAKDETKEANKGQTNVDAKGQTAVSEDAGTTRCKISYSITKQLVQYVLMIDAGSTGSRIHVYRFNNCDDTPELEDEVFEMVQPGLSKYEDDPEGAAKTLDKLMDVAVKSVPKSLQACTPVAVKATAGLRLLGEDKSKKILEAVRHRLDTKYPFPVVKGDGVSIMDGNSEGVYAWITTNYLLGKIGTVEKTPTVAVFDLGGASTQIVFEPTFPSKSGGMPETLKEGDHRYELTFGGRNFTLYQHSHLGYGLKEARKAIHHHVYNSTAHQLGDKFDPKQPIVNPCIAPGMKQTVNIESTKDGKKVVTEVTMVGPHTPSGAQCRAVAESILKKEAPCGIAPCSFNGIHQPPIASTFAKEDAYVISYFYDRLAPLGMPQDFSIREMKEVTAKVCSGEADGGWESFQSTEGALAELRGRPEHCLDLNFMVALLHTGYEMPIDRELKIAKKLKGNELGWCLGASLPLLDNGDGGWTCRIKETF